MPRKIVAVVGARPNLVKIAPILRALGRYQAGAERSRVTPVLVHTGQHYDDALSGGLLADLHLPRPDHQLGVGSGTHAAMTADIMRRLEPVLVAERPDVVLVVGDVNSTVAAALTAAKLHIPVAHVEAGLRSFDRTMPEEVNRVVTDALSDLLFTTEAAADENLRREGRAPAAIHFVGNVMIDSLLWALPRAESSTALDRLGLAHGQDFAILTVHRQGNIDVAAPLAAILSAAAELAGDLPVILPAHPRTRATTVLGVPCLTLRECTERPVTVSAGTSILVGRERQAILDHARAALGRPRSAERAPPPLWDGHAAERIAPILAAASHR